LPNLFLQTGDFMRRLAFGTSIVALTACLARPAMAAEAGDGAATVVVTATRTPIEAEALPAMLSVVSGQDLDARGAGDLRGALALVSGVEAPAGGDAGPASAVTSFWGLHEFDAFLLVEDGVPLGGAFNPAIGALDLTDIDRIEVLKGAAPVPFGQSGFVGVIQAFHAKAGEAAPTLAASVGEHGSYAAHGAVNLGQLGDFAQSLSFSGENQGFADAYLKVRDLRGLYRAEGPLAGGDLGVDLDFTLRRDLPDSPTVRESGGGLTTLTPVNGNYNPADAKLDQNRFHGVIRYSHPTALGDWSSLASFANSDVRDVRGFLRSSLIDTGAANADYLNQRRRILDSYFDTHLSVDNVFGAKLLVGTDLLYGVGHEISRNGEYYVPLNGQTRAPATTSVHVDEINTVLDTRAFSGQYAQLDWSSDGPFTLVAGVRLNETNERKASAHIDTIDPLNNDAESARRIATLVTGSVGASYRVWRAGPDDLVAFADYRNTGQPATIDFGADYTPDILNSERAQIYEAGLKGRQAGGRLSYEVAAFQLDFTNLVVSTVDLSGNPVLENAGGERLRGIEGEARFHVSPGFDLFASASRHDATFTHYVATEGGANVDVSGKDLTLSPHWLAAAGAVYAPASGLGGSLVINFVDRRWVDLENTAAAPAYATVDASLTYKLGHYRFSVRGANLTDRRDAASGSEFGDQSFYRLSGRKVSVGVQMAL
jgi:iron complex outermembrane receptor protein